MLGVLGRVLVVVMLRVCEDGFWFHLAPKMRFGSIGIELELKESKKEVSGENLSGGGRCSATQDVAGRFGVLSIALGRY